MADEPIPLGAMDRSVLAHPVRRALWLAIAASNDGELRVSDLVRVVAKSQSTVSYHLSVMADAGLVARDRRGRWTWYRLATADLCVSPCSSAPALTPATPTSRK